MKVVIFTINLWTIIISSWIFLFCFIFHWWIKIQE